MNHIDEGTIHAWLDGALSDGESAAVEHHVAKCRACADAVAEARGLIAGASRILLALDNVPGGVIPKRDADVVPINAARKPSVSRWVPHLSAIAATLLVVWLWPRMTGDKLEVAEDRAASVSSAVAPAPVQQVVVDSVAVARRGDTALDAISRMVARDRREPARVDEIVPPPAFAKSEATPPTMPRASVVAAQPPRVGSGNVAQERLAGVAANSPPPTSPAAGAVTATSVAAVGAGGGRAAGGRAGGGGGGGGRGGRGGAGAAAAVSFAPQTSTPCYTVPVELLRASGLADAPGTMGRLPVAFSLRADTVGGIVRNAVRSLDSTRTEREIVPGLSWSMRGDTIAIVDSTATTTTRIVGDSPGSLLRVVETGVRLARIPCQIRVSGD